MGRGLSKLERMKARGLELGAESYSAAISACGKRQQWERALSMMAQMGARDLSANMNRYNTAISAYEKRQ